MIKLKNFILPVSPRFELRIDKLEIHIPSRMIIVGPSGSGKTTLMESLAGLQTDFCGSLQIDGQVISDSSSHLYCYNIMFLTQELGLWPHMTCLEHISFMLSKGRTLQAEDSEYWLNIVGLNNRQNARPHELSEGERRRLALARVLSAKPRYLFLDEPFTNIDSVLACELMDKIDIEYERQKFALIKVTHHYFGIKAEHTTIVVVINGKIVQQGTWQQISQHPNNEWTEKWINLSLQNF